MFMYELYLLLVWFHTEKIEAVIIDVKDECWNDGLLQYLYEIIFDNKA